MTISIPTTTSDAMLTTVANLLADGNLEILSDASEPSCSACWGSILGLPSTASYKSGFPMELPVRAAAPRLRVPSARMAAKFLFVISAMRTAPR